MNFWTCLLAAIVIVAIALLFIALGMKLANRYNEIAWEKYYEGMGKRSPSAAPSGRRA